MIVNWFIDLNWIIRFQSTLSSKMKIWQYTKKRLLPYFQSNSLNILRLTFWNIFCTFFTLSEYCENEGQNCTKNELYFLYFTSSYTNRYVVFYSFFLTEMHTTKTKTKLCMHFYSFSIFQIICFSWCFRSKFNFKICQNIATKTEYCNSLVEKSQARFCVC